MLARMGLLPPIRSGDGQVTRMRWGLSRISLTMQAGRASDPCRPTLRSPGSIDCAECAHSGPSTSGPANSGPATKTRLSAMPVGWPGFFLDHLRPANKGRDADLRSFNQRKRDAIVLQADPQQTSFSFLMG